MKINGLLLLCFLYGYKLPAFPVDIFIHVATDIKL